MICPICDENRMVSFVKALDCAPSGSYRYFQCINCGCVFTRCDADVKTENDNSDSRNTDQFLNLRFDRVRERKDNIKKILDFGCGKGQMVEFLQKKGYMVDGVDQYTNLTIWDLLPNSYDVVYMTEVIEHIIEPQPIISQLSSLLKDGGILYIESSFVDHLDIQTSTYVDLAIGHRLVHSEASLNLLLTRNGFNVIKVNNNVFLGVKTSASER